MNRDKASEVARAAIKEIIGDRYEDQPDETLLRGGEGDGSLGLDSLDMVELVMEIELAADRDIPDEAMEKWKTIGDVISSLEGDA